MTAATLGLALLSGLLSCLSPCVLPLLPIVIGTAAVEHKLAPAALAAGLAISFTAIGLFVATLGFAAGLDAGVFRTLAAVLLVTIGIVIAWPQAYERVVVAAGPVSQFANSTLGGFSTSGISGQFGLGLLLGAVWSPCVGPTLGAAAVLASQGEHLSDVALTMATFGVGAALPLLVLGALSRETMLRFRARASGASLGLKVAMGGLLAATGVMILSGLDKQLETLLVEVSPEWLTRLTTSF